MLNEFVAVVGGSDSPDSLSLCVMMIWLLNNDVTIYGENFVLSQPYCY